MTPERARELLGGLAAGILTAEERETLFEAALHDQVLFNEVADELEFASFLQSPETRAQLANRIEVEPPRGAPWWTLRPAWLAFAGVLAASLVLFVAVWHRPGEVTRESSMVPPPAAVQSIPKPEAVTPQDTPKTVEPKQPMLKRQEAAKAEVVHRDQIQAAKPGAGGGGGASAPARLPAAQNAASPPTVTSAQESIAQAPAPVPAPENVPSTQEARIRGAITAPEMAPRIPPQSPAQIQAKSPPSPAPPAAVPMAGLAGFAPRVPTSIEGTVRDPAGAVVPNASIDIVNKATGSATHAKTDPSGRFLVDSLAPGGPYTLIASAPGFRREERDGITLAANQTARVDIPLQIGEMSESVRVTAIGAMMSDKRREPPVQNVASSGNAMSQIAVFDFVNRTPENQSGQQAADLLTTQLTINGQLRMIDRNKVQQAVAQSQSKAKAGGAPTVKEAAALGRRMGADAVIVGTVQPGGSSAGKDSAKGASNIALTAQVIDAKKGKLLSNVAVNGASLQGAASQLGLRLQSELVPMEGAVTAVDAGVVSVRFKAPAEPHIGAHFDVYRGTRRIGELTLTSAYGQTASGKYSGSGRPRPGDEVTPHR